MTTLITGATGFLGSAVTRALLERGEAVRVLARKESDRRNIEGLDVEIAEGDLRDPGSLRNAVKGCRTLYHAAADYRLWARDPDEIYLTNVHATRDLLRLATDAGAERIHIVDLDGAFEGRPVNEDAIGEILARARIENI